MHILGQATTFLAHAATRGGLASREAARALLWPAALSICVDFCIVCFLRNAAPPRAHQLHVVRLLQRLLRRALTSAADVIMLVLLLCEYYYCAGIHLDALNNAQWSFVSLSTLSGDGRLMTDCGHSNLPSRGTKIVQGWPRLWANFRARIGIFKQSVGPSPVIWANPVRLYLLGLRGRRSWRRRRCERRLRRLGRGRGHVRRRLPDARGFACRQNPQR